MASLTSCAIRLTPACSGTRPSSTSNANGLSSIRFNPLRTRKAVAAKFSQRSTIVSELSKPDFVKDNADFEKVWTLLTAKDQSVKDVLPDELLSSPYLKMFVEETGFTEYAEKLNGRMAMVAFVMFMTGAFSSPGDFLDRMNATPLGVIAWTLAINGASMIPTYKSKGVPTILIPDNVVEPVMSKFEELGGSKLFSEEMELFHGRTAMAAVGILSALALIF